MLQRLKAQDEALAEKEKVIKMVIGSLVVLEVI